MYVCVYVCIVYVYIMYYIYIVCVYIYYILMYVCKYICMYVHTCYVLINPLVTTFKIFLYFFKVTTSKIFLKKKSS